MNTFSKRSLLTCLLLTVVLLLPAVALAAPGDPPSTPPPTVTPARSFWIDAILVVILFGAALFVICKSSYRT